MGRAAAWVTNLKIRCHKGACLCRSYYMQERWELLMELDDDDEVARIY